MPLTLARSLAVVWMILIYFLSDQPALDVGEWFPGQDKLLHAIVFGILGALFLASMRRSPGGYRPYQLWIAVGLTAVYGVLDEWHQAFVPGRSPDGWDVVADTVGALIAVALMYRLARPLEQERAGKSGVY